MTRRRNGPVGHLFSWVKVKISFGPHVCLALMKVLYLDQYNARANATATFKHANENNKRHSLLHKTWHLQLSKLPLTTQHPRCK